MKKIVLAIAATMLAGFPAATAVTASVPESKQVHAQGCVQAGVEARCLMVKDLRSGKLYNVLFKGLLPSVGERIEFTGILHNGISMCMQGIPVEVTQWAHKEALKCTPGEAPRK